MERNTMLILGALGAAALGYFVFVKPKAQMITTTTTTTTTQTGTEKVVSEKTAALQKGAEEYAARVQDRFQSLVS